MDLVLKTFNSKSINSGNYQASISDKSPLFGRASYSEIERAGTWGVRGGKRYSGNVMLIDITVKTGSIATGVDELSGWFDEERSSEYDLVIQDANNGSKEWYVKAESLGIVAWDGNKIQVALHVSDPVWKSVTVNSDPASVTATATTNNMTVGGNRIARPVFSITPTAYRTGGYLYPRSFSAVINRMLKPYIDAIDIIDGSWNTANLVADNSNKCQINQVGGITAVLTTIPYDTVTGSLPTAGRGYVDTEQISWTGKTGTTSGNLTGVTRGIGGTTAATHADNAEIKLSYIFANGDDVRVLDDPSGTELYRWFGGGGINSATTKVFINVNLPAVITLTVSGSISNVGAVSTITVKSTAANLSALKQLATQSYKVIAMDMGSGSKEYFTYTNVNINSYQITGVTRAAKGSSNQSHSDGAVIYHMSGGYRLLYGNSSASSPATDDAFKPMIDLANSTNTSHAYTEYYDQDNPGRLCQFTPQILLDVGDLSEHYTADHLTFATGAASEIGIVGRTYTVNGAPRAPQFSLGWLLSHPAGVTTVSTSGEKYRYGSTFPATAGLMVRKDVTVSKSVTTGSGRNRKTVIKKYVESRLTSIWNEASPTALQTWEAFTQNSKSLGGTFPTFGYYFAGTIGVLDSYAAIEFDAVTAALDSNNTPLISFVSSSTADNYSELRITNNTTSQWLEVKCRCTLNDTIVIDTNNLLCYLSSDPTQGIRVTLDDESRAEWLPLDPSLNSGVNQLQYDETGVTGVTWGTQWESRNA